jgi:DNA-binding response OmpR family regulator
VRSFTLGALDYIPKPFDIVEFQVRVNAKLKSTDRTAVKSVLNKGNITVDLVRQQAFEVSTDSRRQLDLTPVEFRMLLLFLQKDGSIVTRREILDTVWGQTAHVSSRCVDHHVCGLRKKISNTGQKIESIYGVGYRIETFA